MFSAIEAISRAFASPLLAAYPSIVEEGKPTLGLWDDDDWWFPDAGFQQPREREEREHRRTAPTPIISLDDWKRRYDNGYIPERAMARVPGTNFLMHPGAAQALGAMIEAAARDGVKLAIGNTYRSYQLQANMYQEYLAGNKTAPVAPPGESNHGWGLAVDFSGISPQAFNWLQRNAARFGFENPFQGNTYESNTEPWHWEWTGGGTGEVPRKPARKTKRAPRTKPSPLFAPAMLIYGPDAVLANSVAMAIQDSFADREGETRGDRTTVEITARHGTPEYWRQVAHRIAIRKGYTQADWKKLDYIIQHESGWNPHAVNPSSGAFGIPQILPSAHPDALHLKNDPMGQIRWLFNYIESRYGSVDAAYRFKLENGWY